MVLCNPTSHLHYIGSWSPLVPEAIEKRVVIIVGAWAAALSFLFVGPSAIMGFPDSVLYCGIGMALVGLFNPVGIVMGLPEMEEASLA